MILIVSIRDDLHALQVRRTLIERGHPCEILECDQVSRSSRLRFSIDQFSTTSLLHLEDGTVVDVESVEVLWWRRVRADQLLDDDQENRHVADLINNDCRGAIAGILDWAFKGAWVSKPDATDRAGNKIFQLAVAQSCGFRVPDTLVSQSMQEVKSFAEGRRVIVKPVVGAAGPLLFTQFLDDPESLSLQSYRRAPAIYQEYIPGDRHIRLNCFGDQSVAVVIETSDLDWRPNLKVPIRRWEVPGHLHKQIRAVLDKLGLAMGIVDLKLTPAGEIVWLEVNPQGQFLFLEALAKLPLTELFSDYLLSLTRTGLAFPGMGAVQNS
ncbi:MAG: hypothetical protein ABJB49_06400 [Nitrospirota bacterium]